MGAQLPAEVFPPGEFLKEELEAREWTQTEFAEITGLNQRTISEIVSAKRSVTPETAIALGEALGTGAQFWMNLESAFQLSKVKVQENAIARRARLYEKFPVKDMIKRGWIQTSQSLDVLERQFMDFFKISTIDETPVIAHAAKKSTYDESNVKQIAWLRRAERLAKAAPAEKFSPTKLEHALTELRACLEYTDAVRNVPAILAKAGVRLVILEAMAGSKIDGACFWLNKSSPVVVLSLRFDRIDNFWHTLMHELDHIKHEEGQDDPIMDIDLWSEHPQSSTPPTEIRANEAAATFSVPEEEMTGFIARVNPLYTDEKIVGFARRIHVHPGIVVGQLQNRGQIKYAMHRKYLEKVRSFVIEGALTDGFGYTPADSL